jgi:hypothetical protein
MSGAPANHQTAETSAPLLIVCVRGGVVQDVFSSSAGSTVLVVDWDEVPAAIGSCEPRPLERLPRELASLLCVGVPNAQAPDI